MSRRRVRRTISLPPELSAELDAVAEATSSSISAVVQEALRTSRSERLRREIARVGTHWSSAAAARGVLTEAELVELAAIVDRPGRDGAFGWED